MEQSQTQAPKGQLLGEVNGMVFQAEDGRLTGTEVATSLSGHSGSGYVTGFDADGDALEVDLLIEQDGYYSIFIRHASLQGPKVNRLFIDGDIYGEMMSGKTTGFVDWTMGAIFLTVGTHVLTISKFWGGVEVDCIKVYPTNEPMRHEPKFDLVNPNASKEAKGLMAYLQSIYGKRIIAGQHTSAASAPELAEVEQITHELPALRGFDLLSYSHNTELLNMTESCIQEIANNRGSVEAAIQWATEHKGIVASVGTGFLLLGERIGHFTLNIRTLI